MASIQKIPKGAQAVIQSNRIGGDKVDKAINNIHKKTGQTVTNMVKESLCLYSGVVDSEHNSKENQLKTATKLNQKRNG